MARYQSFDLDFASEDTDGLADALTGAGPWDSSDFVASSPSDGLAHILSLTSAADLSGITITLTGTDPDGVVISEDVTGPNATSVEGTKYFSTLTGVSASGTLSTNELDIGWADGVSTKTYPLNRYGVGALVQLAITGTTDITVQVTGSLLPEYTEQSAVPWIDTVEGSTLVNATADTLDRVEANCHALRIKVNSYTSGAEVQAYINQDVDL